MFSDSEEEEEKPRTEAGAKQEPIVETKKRGVVVEGGEGATTKKRKARAAAAPQPLAGGPTASVSTSSNAVLDRIGRSYVVPMMDRRQGSSGSNQEETPKGVSAGGEHWTAESVAQARRRGAELRANPSGIDGRAAYERPSMHGREMVISVGPSSLPRACRVTKSRIPAADASW